MKSSSSQAELATFSQKTMVSRGLFLALALTAQWYAASRCLIYGGIYINFFLTAKILGSVLACLHASHLIETWY